MKKTQAITYLFRNIPKPLHDRAMRRAKEERISLRELLLRAMKQAAEKEG